MYHEQVMICNPLRHDMYPIQNKVRLLSENQLM